MLALPASDHRGIVADMQRYGPSALVTGGSSGIGLALARRIARGGLDLVLVADDGPGLEAAAASIEKDCGVRVRTVELDLASEGFLERIRDAVDLEEIGLLVCSAALSPVGRFLDQDPEALTRVLDVNARSTLALVHTLGRVMRERGRGGIVILSSMGALQGTPLVATYAATKAYLLVLGESLWDEMREHGVDVLTVVPGPTRTPGWETEGPRTTFLSPPVMEADEVARQALEALGKRPVIVSGRANRISSALMRLLPRRLATRLVGRGIRAIYPHRR
jgi:short-subunit dehydrogenase